MSRPSGSGSKEHHHPVLGECGYCGQTIVAKKHKFLPLECLNCKGVYHVSCLRGKKPQTLLGDQLFKFTCVYCNPMGQEVCSRPYLHWVHIIHLVLYNLIVGRKSPRGRIGRDKKEYFRWNEDICGFMRSHWNKLMPDRKRTQSWRSTVAGTLSVNCPSVFQSGQTLFGESGWWTLTSVTPPDSRQAITSSPPSFGKRSTPLTLSPPPHKHTSPLSPSAHKHTTSFPLSPPRHKHTSPYSPPPRKHTPVSPHAHRKSTSSIFSPPPTKRSMPLPLSSPPPSKRPKQSSHSSTPLHSPTTPVERSKVTKEVLLKPMTQRQEMVLMKSLEEHSRAVAQSPKASRLLRKLKIRQLQRRYEQPLLDLDKSVAIAMEQTVKYVVDGSKPYYEQVVPVMKDGSALISGNSDLKPSPVEVTCGEDILRKITVLSHPLPLHTVTFQQSLGGGSYSHKQLVSPYTTRILKPFIFRTSDLRPLRVRLNSEICQAKYKICSFDFVYLQKHLLSAVNSFVSNLFWNVDLSEYLQYPDFTCVVLYGHLVVGCGFMTPDVKVNEAYISFLAVHPEFQSVGIGKLMLYHLVQTCMGKDVTLHVSVDNPAMLLYNKFGFKAEKYCLDFYEHYFPAGHYLSKHAYFMRLKR